MEEDGKRKGPLSTYPARHCHPHSPPAPSHYPQTTQGPLKHTYLKVIGSKWYLSSNAAVVGPHGRVKLRHHDRPWGSWGL